LERLCRRLDALPAAEHGDGPTNCDHDRLIYAMSGALVDTGAWFARLLPADPDRRVARA
jgi:hypothetical protein